MAMTETKNWTILKGKVVKIHRKWVTNRICPRIPFLTKRNKYQYLNGDIGDRYGFINKSRYDFRC